MIVGSDWDIIRLVRYEEMVSWFVPHTKSHSIDHYIGDNRCYSQTPLGLPYSIGSDHNWPDQCGLPPIALEVKARSWVEWTSQYFRDVEAFWDHVACMWSSHGITPSYKPHNWSTEFPLQGPLPVALSITAKALVGTYPMALGNMATPRDHVGITWRLSNHMSSMLPSSPAIWPATLGPWVPTLFLVIYFYLIACYASLVVPQCSYANACSMRPAWMTCGCSIVMWCPHDLGGWPYCPRPWGYVPTRALAVMLNATGRGPWSGIRLTSCGVCRRVWCHGMITCRPHDLRRLLHPWSTVMSIQPKIWL